MSSQARGCGSARQKGAVYLECPLSDSGLPIEHFIVDEPIRIDPDQYGLTPTGVKLVEKNGIWHVMDIVGVEHYPNVCDFVEEVRHMGLSRRIAATQDFKKLTSQSKIILLHARAYDCNFGKYPTNTLETCPKNKCDCDTCRTIAKAHALGKLKGLPCMCAACWWHNIEKGEAGMVPGEVVRRMPSFAYLGNQRPERIKKPKYDLAIFMRLPINNIAVIRDPEHGKHEQAEAKACESSLPVELKDE